MPWSGAQQAAFLIKMGREVASAVYEHAEHWADVLREDSEWEEGFDEDPAFYGPDTLINTDQGVRGLLSVTNDLCFVKADELDLFSWVSNSSAGAGDVEAVSEALDELETEEVGKFLANIAVELATFDWRTASAPKLTEEERTIKLTFRGSGGYREIRHRLLRHLSNGYGDVCDAADEVLARLGVD